MILRTTPRTIRRPSQQQHFRYNIAVVAMMILLIQLTIHQSKSNDHHNYGGNGMFRMMVHAIPYVLLQNKAPYCFSTDHMIQPHTTYTINFHAPDMIVIDEIQTEDGDNNNINKENLSYNNIIPPEHRNNNENDPATAAAMNAINEHQQDIIDRGLDIRYQERQQKRYDILKRSVR